LRDTACNRVIEKSLDSWLEIHKKLHSFDITSQISQEDEKTSAVAASQLLPNP